MKGGLLAILEKSKKGESDDDMDADMEGEGPSSSPDMEGEEKKDAFRDLLSAIKDNDVDAGSMALERFVMCCDGDS